MTDILIIEDNTELGNLLCDFLKAENYTVKLATTGEEALEYMAQEKVRLVVLDLMLPGLDGFAVCQKIREDSDTPVFILSARTGKEDKLNGLILGADDYLEKPYDIDILLAKIRGLFKRRYGSDIMTDGNIKIDRTRRLAFCGDRQLVLTAKEYELLLLFLENKGKSLKKEWLFNKVWGFDSFSEPQTLTVHIKWLREKIEDDPKAPRRIITVWGVGYRWE